MSSLHILDKLKREGIQLSKEGEEIKVRALPGKVTPELLAEIRSRKQELLELFRQAEDQDELVHEAPIAMDYPVTTFQQGIWMLSQEQEGSLAYNVPLILQIDEEVELAVLEQAINELIKRHEILRTSFYESPDGSVRQTLEEVAFRLTMKNMDGLPGDQLSEILFEESMQPFDLAKAPLIRGSLLHRSSHSYILLLTLHHIICDGLSLDILQDELVKVYRACKYAVSSDLPPLNRTFKDFANWQFQKMTNNGWQKEEHYWLTHLQGELPVLDLAPGRKRPPVKTYAGQRLHLVMPRDIGKLLSQYCNDEKVSLFAGILATLNTLFFRYTGNEDLVLGTIMSQREGSQLQQVIGPFINTVVLRTGILPDAPFRDVLQCQQDLLLEAMTHSDLPFGRLVTRLNKKKEISRSPLFDILVVFNDYRSAPDAPAKEVSPFTPIRRDLRVTSQFDITFSFEVTDLDISVSIEFNTDIYEEAFLGRLWSHFCELLRYALSDPSLAIKALPFLPPAESQQLLHASNDTSTGIQTDKTILDLIEEAALRHPDKIAITGPGGTFSYQDTWNAIQAMSASLREESIPGTTGRIGVQLDRTVWLPITLLAVLHAGFSYIPLDTHYPAERLNYILQDAQCDRVLTEDWLTSYIKEPRNASSLSLAVMDAPAYIIYTSGSTGRPKGVMITHRNVSAFVQWALQEFKTSPFETLYAVTSHCFDLSVFEFYFTLAAARTLRILPSALYIAEYIQTEQMVMLNTVPSVIQRLLQDPVFPWENISCLNMAGEVVPPGIKKNLESCSMEVRNLYGPTETTTYSTCCLFSHADDYTDIGRPISNTVIYILDPYGNLLPAGLNGEIYIGGAGVAMGYIQNPGLKQDRFLNDAFRPGGKMFRTGDIGRWDEKGRLLFVGRYDHQVKLRGFRIECSEIECLLEQSGYLTRAMVAVKKDAGGSDQLIAYINAPSSIEKGLLQTYLGKYLPVYMLPDRYVYVEEFPLTPNGKLDRASVLRMEIAMSQAPASRRSPGNKEEQAVYAIWSEVLGHEGFGTEDDFFASGANSLHVFRLRSLLRQRMGMERNIRFFFEHTTIAAQAASIQGATRSQELPIPVSAPQDRYPVSVFQKRIWLLCRNPAASRAYNIPGGMKIKGNIDLPALRKSFLFLLERHELLRSTFQLDANGTIFRTLLPMDTARPEMDIPERSPENGWDLLIEENASEIFPLDKGLPFRVSMISMGDNTWYLLYCFHHIVCDGFSLKILEKELLQAYAFFSGKRDSIIPPPAIQYRDYLAWTTDPQPSAGEAFWTAYLGGEFSLFTLPADKPRPLKKSFSGGSLTQLIDPETTRRLAALCTSTNATLFCGLLSALKLLLWRYVRQDELVLGTVVAGRNHSMLGEMVGPLVNTIPIRTRIDGAERFEDLLKRNQLMLSDLYEYQDYPYDRLLDLANDLSNSRISSIFNTIVAFQNQENAYDGAGDRQYGMDTGLDITPLEENAAPTSQMDLCFIFREKGEGLELYLEYDPDIFSMSYMARLLNNYIELLKDIVNRPSAKVSSYNYISTSEKEWLIDIVNSDHPQYPLSSLPALFEEQVERMGDHTAIIAGSTRLSYKELNEYANRFADFLTRNFQVLGNQRIAIQMRRSEHLMIAIWAILKTGCAYVPIDPAYPKERKRYMLRDSECLLMIDDSLFDEFRLVRETYSPDDRQTPINLHQLCYIIYTSGSTGEPKGVAVRHANLVPLIRNANYIHISDSDVILQWANYAFDGSVFEIFGALLNGATLVLLSEDEVTSVEKIKKAVYRDHVSIMFLTPALFNIIVDTDISTFRPLRKLLIGGDILSSQHAMKAAAYMGSGKIINGYGPTETTVFATYYELSTIKDADMAIPIGQPLSNNSIYILDPLLQLLPRGAIGEIFIGGTGVAAGYVNDPRRTTEKFISDPFNSNGCLYKTGDLGRWQEDGLLSFTGRIDHQVKIRGHRIEPGEIEYRLKALDGIRDAIVQVYKTENEEKYLCAYITGTTDDTGGISTALRTLLPEYMIPSFFISLESFPLTPNGKVDRSRLPLPELFEQEKQAIKTLPENELEQGILDLWKKILRTHDLGTDEVFAELGGHSLNASLLLAEMTAAFRVELSIGDILYRSVKEQAALISKQTKKDALFIKKAPPAAEYPLSEQQLGLFAADVFLKDTQKFKIGSSLHLKGDVRIDLLERSIHALYARHEILRTIYGLDDNGDACQIIQEETMTDGLWHFIDLSGEKDPSAERSWQIERLSAEPFDLLQGPLFKTTLFKCGDKDYVLLLLLHHIVSDGWGMEILIEDLLSFYIQGISGDPAIAPKDSIQYKDYAVWQKEQLQGTRGEEAGQFWRSCFVKRPDLPDLSPYIAATPDQKDAVLSFELDTAIFDKLTALSYATGNSLFVISLSALNILLYSLTGQTDITVSSPFAGRTTPGTSRLVGCLVNLLPIRTQFSGDDTIRDMVTKTGRKVTEIYPNQLFPATRLNELVQEMHHIDIKDLYAISINYQHFDMVSRTRQEEHLSNAGLEVRPFELPDFAAKYDLNFVFTERHGRLFFSIEYNAGKFDAPFVSVLSDRFIHILHLLTSERELQSPLSTINHLLPNLNQYDQAHS